MAFQVPAPQIPFVMLAGQAGATPIKVLLDTGNAAPFTVILGARSHAASEAKKTGAPDYVTHAVAGGRTATITPATLASFSLGPIRLTGVNAGLSDSVDVVASRLPGGVDAIVGYQLLGQRVISVDYAAHTLDLDAQAGPAAGALPMTVTPGKPLTVIEVRVNGKGPFHLAIDTGAGGSILSPQAAHEAGVGTGGVALQLGGAGGFASPGRLERATLDAGGRRWTDAPVIVADLMGPVSAESGMVIDGILGAPQLARGRLILDYPGRRVWIGEGAAK